MPFLTWHGVRVCDSALRPRLGVTLGPQQLLPAYCCVLPRSPPLCVPSSLRAFLPCDPETCWEQVVHINSVVDMSVGCSQQGNQPAQHQGTSSYAPRVPPATSDDPRAAPLLPKIGGWLVARLVQRENFGGAARSWYRDQPSSVNSIPYYETDDCARQWLARLDRAKRMYGWTDDQTLDVAVCRLGDSAATWYSGVENSITTWAQFQITFQERFEANQEELYNLLARCQQRRREPVREYADRFRDLASQLSLNTSDPVHTFSFLRGLQPDIYDQVFLLRPKTLEEAIHDAIYIEEGSQCYSAPSSRSHRWRDQSPGRRHGRNRDRRFTDCHYRSYDESHYYGSRPSRHGRYSSPSTQPQANRGRGHDHHDVQQVDLYDADQADEAALEGLAAHMARLMRLLEEVTGQGPHMLDMARDSRYYEEDTCYVPYEEYETHPDAERGGEQQTVSPPPAVIRDDTPQRAYHLEQIPAQQPAQPAEESHDGASEDVKGVDMYPMPLHPTLGWDAVCNQDPAQPIESAPTVNPGSSVPGVQSSLQHLPTVERDTPVLESPDTRERLTRESPAVQQMPPAAPYLPEHASTPQLQQTALPATCRYDKVSGESPVR
eukprot:XP_001692791.1 predicted protein [Chlamydomonas reinhardtii]